MQRCLGCMKEYEAEFDLCPYCGYIKDTPAKSKNHLEPGTEIANRYIIGKSLGQGGFGITYIAWDNKIQKTVTIKEFFPNALSTRGSGEVSVSCFNDRAEAHFKEGMKKMLDEGRRLSKFTNNENIVDVYDFFEENNTSYIVMEYLSGKDLKQYLEEKGGKLDPEEAVEIILPVLNALSDMHNAQLIHRDVAPDNIFLCDNGKIKLLDFGSARLAVDENEKSLSIMLKHGFAPKEQYSSRSKQGPWTDVYAVCATLYRMITGEVPPDSIDRKSDSLKPLSAFGITDFAALEEVITKGLEIESEDRYQDMKTLHKELVSSLEKKSSIIVKKESNTSAKTNNTNSKKNSKKIIIAAVAAIVLVAGLVSGTFFADKFKKDKTGTTTESSTSTTVSVSAETSASISETTENTTFALNSDEVRKIYEDFLGSNTLKETHPNIYAIKTKNISACSKAYAEYLETSYIKNFSLAKLNTLYGDFDNDGTEEMLLSADAGGDGFYIDLYLFDIDTEYNVFEGGSFLRLQPSRCYDHISVMQDSANKYYFIKYTNDGFYSKHCENIVYDGKKFISKYTLNAENPNLKPGYGEPCFIKTNGYSNEKNNTILTSEEFFSEWKKCFNNKHISGYCDDNWAEQTKAEKVNILKSGQVTKTIDWTLFETGLLWLQGSGKMQNYLDMYDITPHDFRPWNSDGEYKDQTIKSVVISDGITSIGDHAFAYCRELESILIPKTITHIGNSAFEFCEKLVEFSIPNNVISIGQLAFSNCESISNINIPSSVSQIGDSAFSHCNNLKNITVSNNNQYYSSDNYGVLFNKNKTELIQYPNANENKEYIIPSSVHTINENAFWDCQNLENIVIPNSVTSLGCFGYCSSLTSIVIPSSISNINSNLLYRCYNLTSITIPVSVTSIDEWAFEECESITDIYYEGSWLQWQTIAIGENNDELSNATIHYNS